jgi:hypothetical protein
MKEGSLFCFVLFWFVCYAEMFQTTVLHVAFLTSLESSQWLGVHWLDFRVFGATVWKPLIIELFFQWKLNKIENWKIALQFGGCSWCYWKALGKSDLIEFISQFSELRWGRYCFLNGFCCWKFKQSAKIGFRRKNQLSRQCVHIAKFRKQFLKCEK